MAMVAKQVSKVPLPQPGKASRDDYLPLPRQMQAMILQSTDVNCALEEVSGYCFHSVQMVHTQPIIIMYTSCF